MATTDDYDSREDLDWFRDQLRQRDRQISELRNELDEANDILRRFDEYVEDYNGTMESWRETFDMELTDGGWTWQPFWNEYADLVERHQDLVRQWNRIVPIVNASTRAGSARRFALIMVRRTNVWRDATNLARGRKV